MGKDAELIREAIAQKVLLPAPPSARKRGQQRVLVPLSISTKKSFGDSFQRSLRATRGSPHIVLKGTGSGFRFKEEKDRVIYPFYWITRKEELESKKELLRENPLSFLRKDFDFNPEQRFGGGAQRHTSVTAVKAANALHAEYEKALSENDSVVRSARKHGVKEAGTLKPFGLFKPLQSIVEFHKYEENSPTAEAFARRLEPDIRRVFRHWYARAKPGEKIVLKTSKRLYGTRIPRVIQKYQTIFGYAIDSAYRLREMSPLYERYLSDSTGAPFLQRIASEMQHYKPDWQYHPEKQYKSAMKKWKDIFRYFGFHLTEGRGSEFITRGKSWKDYTVRKGGRMVDFTEARKSIMEQFAARQALNIHLMHNRLKGTFTAGEFSSFATQNTSPTGHVADLDTVSIGGGTAKEKQKDIEYARENIRLMARLLSKPGEKALSPGAEEELLEETGNRVFGRILRPSTNA